MTLKVIKIDCATALNPRLHEGKLQIFVDKHTCWIIDPEDAKKFYTMNIGRDATVPSNIGMGCGLHIMGANREEYLFDFPISQSAKALEWFHIIHEILTPEKRGFVKWATSKVAPSRT